MKNELISVSQIVSELGKQKSHLFKVLDRLRIERTLQKSSRARGQKIAYVTTEDYERIKEYFSGINGDASESIVDSDTGGVFYLIQLEPEHDSGRIKLGFATNIEERLRSHKREAPFAKVVKTWPCKLLWEKTAIECVVQNCERLHTDSTRLRRATEARHYAPPQAKHVGRLRSYGWSGLKINMDQRVTV